MNKRRSPGTVRDAILRVLEELPKREGTTKEILQRVRGLLGDDVASSSVRSHLRLNKTTFEHVARGRYRLKGHR
jgi:hypothetical protein